MKKITVYLPVWAEYSVEVEVPDDKFEEEDFEEAIDSAYDKLPSGLCHHCATGNTGAGFFGHSEVYLELGEQPEAKYALDEEGKVVWGDRDEKLGW
jgi:hypothetical protein